MMDMQIGFGMVNVYDPQSNSQVPITGQLLDFLLLIVFFLSNGHQILIGLVFRTLEALPIGTVTVSPQIGIVALEIFADSFLLGVMIGLPITASGLILEFTFGALVRTVPQMNMFVVGIPLKLFVGLMMLMFLIPVFVTFSDTIFTQMFDAMDSAFATLRGA
jgi:flagellar biosynthetic protein FliR